MWRGFEKWPGLLWPLILYNSILFILLDTCGHNRSDAWCYCWPFFRKTLCTYCFYRWSFYRYSRMPGELLPTVFTSLQERITNGFSFKSDQTGLLVSHPFLFLFCRYSTQIISVMPAFPHCDILYNFFNHLTGFLY